MNEQAGKKPMLVSILAIGLVAGLVVQSVVILSLSRRLARMETGAVAATASAPRRAAVTNSDGGSFVPFRQPWRDDDSWDLDAWSDWDPFKEMRAIQERINQMFGSAFNRFQGSRDFGALLRDYAFSPDLNLEDRGDHYLVTVDLPGVEETRVEVRVEGQTLTISGSSESAYREQSGQVLRQERRCGRFYRVLTLPARVKGDQITTESKRGVLYVKIPKRMD